MKDFIPTGTFLLRDLLCEHPVQGLFCDIFLVLNEKTFAQQVQEDSH